MRKYQQAAKEYFEEIGYVENITENNFVIPAQADYVDFGEETEEWDVAAERPGLWENIRRKKQREGDNYRPAKPGDPDRPTQEQLKRAQGDKDVFDNPGEAMERAKELGLDKIHTHKGKDGKTIYMPGETHEEYMKAIKSKGHKAGPMEDHIFVSKDAAMKFAKKWDDLSNNVHTTKTGDGKTLYIPGKDEAEFRKWYKAHKGADAKELSSDVFDNPGEAMKRAKEMGLDEIHTHKNDKGDTIFMPGKTHEEYMDKMKEKSKALQYGKPPKNDPRKTPAPKKDQKKGSKKNPKDSAKKPNKSIKFSKKVTDQLKGMVSEHNKKGKGSKATLGALKAVYRRGAGAYSTSHAPKMSRHGWAIARVKAFLYLLRNGRPSNPNYKQDNDLLPSSHPKKSKGAEYQGRKVTLNKPFRTPDGPKKFSVYTKNEKGNVVKVNFGDPNMEIKRDNPARRRSFRARHKCDTAPGPKWKARYWSCKMW